MKLIELNWRPTDRQLRQFSAICLVALPLVGWIWGADTTVIGVLAAIGLTIGLAGFSYPATVKPVFQLLMLITTPIGMLIGELAMILIYFGCFLPIGLVFRLFKRDALNLKLNRSRPTYWVKKKHPTGLASYYRQS